MWGGMGEGGREAQEGGDTCIHVADSRPYTAETNNTVKQLYSNKKKWGLYFPIHVISLLGSNLTKRHSIQSEEARVVSWPASTRESHAAGLESPAAPAGCQESSIPRPRRGPGRPLPCEAAGFPSSKCSPSTVLLLGLMAWWDVLCRDVV